MIIIIIFVVYYICLKTIFWETDQKFMAEWYIDRKRNVRPVDYSETTRREFRDAEVDIKVERISTMQSTITHLNNVIERFVTQDLTEDEITDTVAFLLAAGDDIRVHEEQTSKSKGDIGDLAEQSEKVGISNEITTERSDPDIILESNDSNILKNHDNGE